MPYGRSMNGIDNGSQAMTCRVQYLDDTDPFSSTNFPEPTRPPNYTFNTDLPLCEQLAGVHRLLKAPHKIGDCTLQLSSTNNYLDLDLSISEQKEEFESFNTDGKRNSVILRTQLSVRVHSCIEKLYNSKGRELRRALFSLKQIFQDDKDLVHQFVNADGLTCLIKVGAEADQNYQNYILRALGQIMLYVDGMEGVIRHSDTIRWLYSLIASKFRLVIKTSLKLQLVFVEYSETNAQVLLRAAQYVDSRLGRSLWSNIMEVLGEKDGIDSELLVYAMTLVNKTLSNITDQDTFYDVTDALEEQKICSIAQRHLNKKGNDPDLIEQFKIYEMSLKHEDGDEDVSDPTSPGSGGIKWNRERTKSEVAGERKSKRRNSLTSVPTLDVITDAITSQDKPTPVFSKQETPEPTATPKPLLQQKSKPMDSLTPSPAVNETQTTPRTRRRGTRRYGSPSSQVPVITDHKGDFISPRRHTRLNSAPSAFNPPIPLLSPVDDNGERVRKRRERRLAKCKEMEERRNLNAENDETSPTPNGQPLQQNGMVNGKSMSSPPPLPPTRTSTSKVLEKRKMEKKLQELQQQQQQDESLQQEQKQNEQKKMSPESEMKSDIVRSTRQRRRHHDHTSKPPLPTSVSAPAKKNNGDLSLQLHKSEPEKPFSRLDRPTEPLPLSEVKFSGEKSRINRSSDVITTDQKLLMDMLYANQAVASKQTESDEGSDETASTENEPSETSISVKEMAEKLKGTSMNLVKGLKPSEPQEKEIVVVEPPSPIVKKDSDIMWEKLTAQSNHEDLVIEGFDFSGLTALDDVDHLAPVPGHSHHGIHPPPSFGGVPPPPPMGVPPPPPPPPGLAPPPPPVAPMSPPTNQSSPAKPRTVRLFWKEASHPPDNKILERSNVWTDIDDVEVEAEKFINLFLLKTKDVAQKKQQTEKRNELRVLEVKRSNAINIGLTVLPPPRTIKSAIINMDEFALAKEQIEKLLTMVPTEEEISAIQEGMQASPDVALGSAEQFLLTLSSISELEARLNLWAFKLDYDILEKEVAEPLQDLKDGIDELKSNKTLRRILATLKAIGNLLNNTKVKGFDISYLTKVPEVKDTTHKQSLLHHVTHCVLEKYPDASDLYSELGSLTRCSRIDFEVLEETLQALENRCKNSWDYLKLIAKHESKAAFRSKLSEFLISCAQKIIRLKMIHSRLVNRFRALLLYFGSSPKAVKETTIQGFTRMISEFALEYRTSKERVESQRKKKHQKGERNRTRGKMIMEENILSDAVVSDEEYITRRFSTTEDQMKQMLMEKAIKPDDSRVEKRTRSRSNRERKSKDATPGKPVKAPQPDDDEIMEQLVKTATQAPLERSTPVSRRKRSRNTQRKSLRRTLKSGLTDEEKAVIMGNY